MARNSAEASCMMDPSIPQWKRELLVRRRALGRTLQVGNSSVKLTCPAVVAVVRQPEVFGQSENVNQNSDVITATSGSEVDPSPHLTSSDRIPACNMRLLDTNCVVLNGGEVRNKQSEMCVNHNIIMSEEKPVSLKNKSASTKTRTKLTQNSCGNFNSKYISEPEEKNGITKDEELLSDSSEELQYGPGIVNRLKSKYLSMTLREQKRNSRPSIINLRRATSLENMLEVEGNINNSDKKSSDTMPKTENKPTKIYNRTTNLNRTAGPNSTRAMKYLGNRSLETMKRARSMDTLLKSDPGQTHFKENVFSNNTNQCIKNDTSLMKPIASIVNENIIIVENTSGRSEITKTSCDWSTIDVTDSKLLRSSSVNSDTQDRELPPPDLVKQTLKIFEPSPKRKTKASNSNLSKLVAEFSNLSSQPSNKSVNNRSLDKTKMSPKKPSISPKPILSPEKLKQNRSRIVSPKKVINHNNTDISTKSSSPVECSKRLSNNSISSESSLEHSENNLDRARSIHLEDKSLTNPSSPSKRSYVLPVSKCGLSEDNSSSKKVNDLSVGQSAFEDSVKSAYSCEDRPIEEIGYKPNDDIPKPVLESALENIRKGGVSVQFSFNNDSSDYTAAPKTYLPVSKTPPQALNSSLLKQKLESSPSNIAPLRTSSSPISSTKQIGIIRPLVSTKNQSPLTSPVVLTEQEIEKNLINRVKSSEQPISKVVVAIKAMPDNVVLGSVSESVTNKNLSLPPSCTNPKTKSQGLWDQEKIWQQNQNTIVFNFSDRKEVPDYIENDGLILRGKREKPRPGEGGIILLEGAGTVEESYTDNEDLLSLEPPSPCDVTFLNDNILINGKSNLQKSPKQVKLRIKFNDEATTMFEYPSEASLVEDEPASAECAAESADRRESAADVMDSSTSNSSSEASASTSSLPPAMPLGGSLGAYTPRKMGAGAWQLGVTPVSAPPASASPSTTAPSDTDTEDHLKPAPPESTVTWSSDTASDLLF